MPPKSIAITSNATSIGTNNSSEPTPAAIAAEQVDRAYAAYRMANQRYLQAMKRYELVKEGPRQEEIEQAKAAMEQAQAQYRLVKEGPRKEDIDQARAKVEQAKASLQSAETKLGYATVTSPLTGVVLSKNTEPGEYVAPGTPVVTVADIENVWLRAYVDERDLGKRNIALGTEAEITTDAYPGKVYKGRVSFISSEQEFTPKSVQTNRERVKFVYRIKIDVKNPDRELKPGMPADAKRERRNRNRNRTKQEMTKDGRNSRDRIRIRRLDLLSHSLYLFRNSCFRDSIDIRISDCHDRAEHLTKKFDDFAAIDDLSLAVEEGEIFGLVGPDGAGKTTTMRLLTSIMDPDGGEAWVAGHHVVREAEAVKAEIGYMSQRFGLYADLTVMENLDFYADIYNVPRKGRDERIQRLLAFSNLTPFKRRLAGNLSGGMKQKLGLACTLVHTPRVLFLDEPTNGVDPVSRRDFWRILYQLLREKVTIFVSTAYLDEAERCNRLALIHQGRMLACGTPDEVKQLMRGTILEIRIAEPRQAAAVLRQQFPAASVGLFGDRVHFVQSTARARRIKSARPSATPACRRNPCEPFRRRWRTCSFRR